MSLVKNSIKKQLKRFDFSQDHRFLLAISGGVDSMVLLHLFKELKLNCSVAHLNFSLRGAESDLDEKLVNQTAKKFGFKFYSQKVDTRNAASEMGVSTQMAAREIRYKWFSKLMQEHKLDTLVTAHHLDDSVETFFINLNRGTGLKGLHGIPSDINKFRPLTNLSKEDIRAYALEQQVKFREDATNQNSNYQRNWFRNELIKSWKQRNPSFLKIMQSNMRRMDAANNIVQDALSCDLDKLNEAVGRDEIEFSLMDQLKYPVLSLFEVLSIRGFNETQVDEMLRCKEERQVGKRFFSQGFTLFVDRDKFELRAADGSEQFQRTEIQKEVKYLDKPIQLSFQKISVADFKPNRSPRKEGVDFEKLNFPLELRKWEEGDKMKPLGLNGQKKISDILIDAKISLAEKDQIMVITSNKNIVWLVGLRVDERFKVEENSQEVYLMEWQT